MLVVITIFLLTFAALNLYVFRWLRPGLGLKRRGTVFLFLFLLTMVFMPLVVHYCRGHKLETPHRVLGFITYCWMTIVMWVVCFGFAAELWNLGVRIVALKRAERNGRLLSARTLVLAVAVFIAIFTIWGSIEVRNLKLETIHLSTDKLVPDSPSIRILHLSDLHLGQAAAQGVMWNKLVKLSRDAKPDMIVCTGDLLDGSQERVADELKALAAMKAPLGKFAVFGNHEFYVGEEESVAALSRAGFRILRAEHTTVTNRSARIRVAGVDDLAARQMGMRKLTDEKKALPPADGVFTVLLKHQPLVNQKSIERFDLQLSGHLHGGQILPFQFFVWFVYGTFTGLHDVGGHTQLYVSSGAGAWGPPLRVLAPPRITLIVIGPEKDGA